MKNKDYYKLENLIFRIIERNDGEVNQVLNGNELVFEYVSRSPNEQIRKLIFFNIYTEWLNSEHEILSKKEKDYLREVIKPFRRHILNIQKKQGFKEFIKIIMDNNDFMVFPSFELDTKYRGMKQDKAYTLEELGL